jgi:hypothetical protein
MILLYVDTDSTANDIADFTIFIVIGIFCLGMIALFTALGIYYRFQGEWFFRCIDFFVQNPRVTVEQLYINVHTGKPMYTMDKHYPLKIIMEVTTKTGEIIGNNVAEDQKSTTRVELEKETTETNPDFVASQLSHLTGAGASRRRGINSNNELITK